MLVTILEIRVDTGIGTYGEPIPACLGPKSAWETVHSVLAGPLDLGGSYTGLFLYKNPLSHMLSLFHFSVCKLYFNKKCSILKSQWGLKWQLDMM